MGAADYRTAVLTMTTGAFVLLLVPLWPGLLALVTLAFHKHRLGGLLAISGAVPALGASMFHPPLHEASYPWLLLGTRFGVDEADAIFLLGAAVVWLLASSFAFGWIPRQQGRERFFALFLLTMSGNLGTLVAQDMPSFYAFFALMSFAAYGLIAHKLTRKARHAANVYVTLVVIGEGALAVALILASGSLGSNDFIDVRLGLESLPLRHLIIALAFLGFGIKAGVLILHVWLPLAHPVAPAPASAVLSGTIIVTGLVGWLRFLPVGEWALPGWGGMCVVLGLAAAFYAAIVGMDQREPKVVLAYSSISQMGIMTVAIGMILLEPELSKTLSIAIAFFALHHGLAKSALFLGAGLGKTDMDAKRRRWLVIGLSLPSLALTGAPLTSGMAAKSVFVTSEALLPGPWVGVVQFILPLTSVATALLMARFLILVNRRPAEAKQQVGRQPWLTWCASLLLVLLLPLYLMPSVGFSLSIPSLVDSLWPLALALAVALIAIWTWRHAGRPVIPEIPTGDVLLPMERLTLMLWNRTSLTIGLLRPVRERILRAAAAGHSRAWTLIQITSHAEALLNRWGVALILALLLGTVVTLLAWP
jgi:formate hydrogenlyase subunit 3/multisubunit Na+/H+ antiporter MnhD subunit